VAVVDPLEVPTAALFRRGNDWTAWLKRKGTAEEVGTSVTRITRRLVGKSDLAEGQRVILYPADTISDGVAVKIMPELKAQ
jgi:HlyD family secretion protein